jgi:UDP-hydrolysing UDP-N-acetyl-D-glucosamine 2-epimerase
LSLYIIAEAGVNHDGLPGQAHDLVDMAKRAGADAVKFQLFNTMELVSPDARMAEYQKECGLGKTVFTQFDMLKGLELEPHVLRELKAHCTEKGLDFIVTPFDKKSLSLAARLDVNIIKLSSDALTDAFFLELAAAYVSERSGSGVERKLVMSTGMADIYEIRQAVNLVLSRGAPDPALLYCVSAYPACLEEINLKGLEKINLTFPGFKTGFSDHTLDDIAGICAVSMGAVIIEKHITLDRGFSGPDHRASMDEHGFTGYVKKLRSAHDICFKEVSKKAGPRETEVMKHARRSLFAELAISRGQSFAGRVAAKRPGQGISSFRAEAIKSTRTAKRNYRPGEMIDPCEDSLKICAVTGSRADYGLLFPLLRRAAGDPFFEVHIAAGGVHFSAEQGNAIEKVNSMAPDFVNFTLHKIDMDSGRDDNMGICSSFARGIKGYSALFNKIDPDLVIGLGDRYELLSAVTAAYLSRIPVTHIHGGEVTRGFLDDPLRHAVTKLSTIHFTASPEYYNRVIQLGEEPERVFLTGAPGIDNINDFRLLSKPDAAKLLQIPENRPYVLVTWHPNPLDKEESDQGILNILEAAAFFPELVFVFTMPNQDHGHKSIVRVLEQACNQAREQVCSQAREQAGPAIRLFNSLGTINYLSALKWCAFVAGNSSSGIIEAPVLKKPAVNIGSRQAGRLRSPAVIDCACSVKSIKYAFKKALNPDFKRLCRDSHAAYGMPGGSDRILNEIKRLANLKDRFRGLLKKDFYDLSGDFHD